METLEEIIKKIPNALTNLGITNEDQKKHLENYIINLVLTGTRYLRSLPDEEYQKFLKSL